MSDLGQYMSEVNSDPELWSDDYSVAAHANLRAARKWALAPVEVTQMLSLAGHHGLILHHTQLAEVQMRIGLLQRDPASFLTGKCPFCGEDITRIPMGSMHACGVRKQQ